MVPEPGGNLVSIGKVGRPWGCYGEVKILPLTDHPERFQTLTRVYLIGSSGKPNPMDVSGIKVRSGSLYLKLAGVDSPEAARQFTGHHLCVTEEERIALPEGEFFHSDLIGLEVATEDGEVLGRLEEIIPTGAHDVYLIKGEREYLVPAVESFIVKVDLEAGQMVIHAMEGLLDV